MCWTERARGAQRVRGVRRHGYAAWLCGAAWVALGWSALGVRADEVQPVCGTAVDGQAPQRRVIEVPFEWDSVPVLPVTIGGQSRADGGLRTCPPVIVTHTDASFTGGNYIAQAGFAETEIAAASYTIAATEFPIKINLMEMIFATQNAIEQTVTQWSILVWEGNPDTGTLVASYSSDDIVLPHLRLGPGTAGANVQVSVDPSEPEQIYIYDTGGSHTFSVGYRIDQHNYQVSNPCFTAPPSNRNAFPTVDTSGRAAPSQNWLWGVNCGALGCPANGGWSNFTNLASYCRPSGDWIIRVTYEPVNCGPLGACCDGTTCTETSAANCTTGVFQGDGTVCTPNPCLTGACCHADLSCTNAVQQSGCQAAGDSFYGGQTCAQVSCPPPSGACCVGGSCIEGPTEATCINSLGGYWAGPGTVCDPNACMQACCFLPDSCVDLNLDYCHISAGFPQGVGTACATTTCFPAGACCYPNGSCGDNVAPGDCTAAGGTFQGDGVLCSGVSCPQPNGACCLSSNSCIGVPQASCNGIPGAHWAGPLTTCFTGLCPICDSGDTNTDGDVDFQDFGQFQTCYQGPLGGTGACKCVDMDNDNDVDLNDYQLFYDVFNVGGPQ